MAITSVWLSLHLIARLCSALQIKSRTRDFLFLAHALTAVTVLFPQLPYLVAWGQYCRLSLLSMPCASPLKNGLHRNFLDLTG